MKSKRSVLRVPVLAVAVLLAAAAPLRAEIVYEIYDDPAAFAARLGGDVRSLRFEKARVRDRLSADGSFAEDAFLDVSPFVIRNDAAGGMFASRDFGLPTNFRLPRGALSIAPGPVGSSNETFSVRFREESRDSLVAAFACTFVDADFPQTAASSFDALGSTGSLLSRSGTVSGKNRQAVFRGVIAVDSSTGRPVPVIRTAEVHSGEGWPGVRAFEGVTVSALDCDSPVPVVAAGSFAILAQGIAARAGSGVIPVTIERLGGASGSASVRLQVSGAFADTDQILDFVHGESRKSLEVPFTPTSADGWSSEHAVTLSDPTDGAETAPGRSEARVRIDHLLPCTLEDASDDLLPDLFSHDVARGEVYFREPPGRSDFAAGPFDVGGASFAAPGNFDGAGGADLVHVDGSRGRVVFVHDPFPGPAVEEAHVASGSLRGGTVVESVGARDAFAAIRGNSVFISIPSEVTAEYAMPGAGPAALAWGEFDGRAGTDVVAVCKDGAIRSVNLRTDAVVEVGRTSKGVVAAAAGFVDGDARHDLVVVTRKRTAEFLTRTNQGFTSFVAIGLPGKPGPAVLVDLAFDGYADLVVAQPGGIAVVENRLTFVGEPTVIRGSGTPRALHVCDIDRDGDADVLALLPDGGIDVYENDVTGTLTYAP